MFLGGAIDDLLVYGRELSSNEVTQLYQGAFTTPPAVTLSVASVSPSSVQLILTGARNAALRVERASGISGPWTNLGSVVLDSAGTAILQDSNLPPVSAFYRALQP